MPTPPVGGIPYSSASTKSSSIGAASSSPAAASARACSKRARWSAGSFSSLKPLANSMPSPNASKRSVSSGSSGERFANGESSTG